MCKTNEQACFRALIAKDEPPLHAQRHVFVASGLVWNRHPHDRRKDPAHPILDWATNPATEIVHMMGGAKVCSQRANPYHLHDTTFLFVCLFVSHFGGCVHWRVSVTSPTPECSTILCSFDCQSVGSTNHGLHLSFGALVF